MKVYFKFPLNSKENLVDKSLKINCAWPVAIHNATLFIDTSTMLGAAKTIA